jgi:hypothetical protein
MPAATPNTIVYKGRLSRRYEEGDIKSGASLYPGMIIEKHTDGTFQPHATAGGACVKRIVIEDGFGPSPTGTTLTGKKLTDPYVQANGDKVRVVIAAPGEMFYMLLKDGETATVKSMLSSNGDGKLQVLAGSEVALFESEEALAPSGADGYLLCTAL